MIVESDGKEKCWNGIRVESLDTTLPRRETVWWYFFVESWYLSAEWSAANAVKKDGSELAMHGHMLSRLGRHQRAHFLITICC